MSNYNENENFDQTTPDQPETVESADSQLAVRLRDISHTLRSLNEGRGSQRRILTILREAGTITQRELTERLDIRSASASEVIAKLEDTGLITRTPSEEDRRTADISLTEAGQQQAEAAQQPSRYAEMFSALTGEEKEQLLALLEKLGADWGERYPSGRERYRGDRERRGKGRRHDKHGEDHCCGGHEEGHRHDKHGEDHHCGEHGGGHRHDKHGEDHHHGGHGDGRRREMHGEGRHEMREEGRHGKGCDHDCEHCANPCGKGRAKRGTKRAVR